MSPRGNRKQIILKTAMSVVLIGGTLLLIWCFLQDEPYVSRSPQGTARPAPVTTDSGKPLVIYKVRPPAENQTEIIISETPVEVEETPTPEENQTVMLKTELAINLVRAKTREGIPDVKITLYYHNINRSEISGGKPYLTMNLTKTTDSSGFAVFVIDMDNRVTDIECNLSLTGEGFIQPPYKELRFNIKNGFSETREIVLESAGSIEGKIVFKGMDGPPYPVISLAVAVDAGGTIRVNPEMTIFRSNNAGKYRVTGLLPRSYFIIVYNMGVEYEQISPYEAVTAVSCKTIKGPTITIGKMPVFRGVAHDSGGRALAGQRVTINGRSGWFMFSEHPNTDASGRFEVTLPRGADWVDFKIQGHETIRLTHNDLESAAAGGGDLGTLVFKKGVRIWGRVVSDSTGEPVNYVRVRATPVGHSNRVPDWTSRFYQPTADRSGESIPRGAEGMDPDKKGGWFEIPNVPAGKVVLEAQNRIGNAVLRFKVEPGANSGPHELRLKASGKVSGILLWSEDGKPAAGMTVGAYAISKGARKIENLTSSLPRIDGSLVSGSINATRTGADGAFAFSGLPIGRYVLLAQIRKKGCAYRAISEALNLTASDAGVENIRLSLKSLRTIKLTVFTPSSVNVSAVGVYLPGGGMLSLEQDGPPFVLEAYLDGNMREVVVQARGCMPQKVSIPTTTGLHRRNVELKSAGGNIVTVTRIFPNSAADKAGIKVWDIITSYNGSAVSSRGELMQFIRNSTKSGKKLLAVKLLRNGKKITVTVPPGSLGVGLN